MHVLVSNSTVRRPALIYSGWRTNHFNTGQLAARLPSRVGWTQEGRNTRPLRTTVCCDSVADRVPPRTYVFTALNQVLTLEISSGWAELGRCRNFPAS